MSETENDDYAGYVPAHRQRWLNAPDCEFTLGLICGWLSLLLVWLIARIG